MCAAMNGHAEVAQLLLDAGADTEATDAAGQTALGLAKQRHRDDVAELVAAHSHD